VRRILLVVSVLAWNVPAWAESIRVLGAKLGPTEPENVFTATHDHIVVTGLPKNWGVFAGQCFTAVPGQYPSLKFAFNDGNTSSKKLLAAGWAQSTGEYGLPATSLTLCRDSAANIASITAQVVMLGSSGSFLELYVVNTTNTSSTSGSSYSELTVTNFQEEQSFTAYSAALNRVTVRQ
jgi:hypothetical protein